MKELLLVICILLVGAHTVSAQEGYEFERIKLPDAVDTLEKYQDGLYRT